MKPRFPQNFVASLLTELRAVCGYHVENGAAGFVFLLVEPCLTGLSLYQQSYERWLAGQVLNANVKACTIRLFKYQVALTVVGQAAKGE
jgi:hypothetical protein